MGYWGMFRVYSASETAQVELKRGRVKAPAAGAAWGGRRDGLLRDHLGSLQAGAYTRPLLSST